MQILINFYFENEEEGFDKQSMVNELRPNFKCDIKNHNNQRTLKKVRDRADNNCLL